MQWISSLLAQRQTLVLRQDRGWKVQKWSFCLFFTFLSGFGCFLESPSQSTPHQHSATSLCAISRDTGSLCPRCSPIVVELLVEDFSAGSKRVLRPINHLPELLLPAAQ